MRKFWKGTRQKWEGSLLEILEGSLETLFLQNTEGLHNTCQSLQCCTSIQGAIWELDGTMMGTHWELEGNMLGTMKNEKKSPPPQKNLKGKKKKDL